MRYVLVLLLITALPLLAHEAADERAANVTLDGISLPTRVQARADNSSLVLNGAGMRRKFFLDVYIGALYLPKPAHSAAEVLAMPGPKRMSMIFRREVATQKLVDAWTEGFRNNLSAEEFRAQRARIANFNGLFSDVKSGDRVDISAEPGVGTQVWLNDKLRGKVGGDDFYAMVLRVWLGEQPADGRLKRALLGDH